MLKIKEIDGLLFEKMVISGLQNLKAQEAEINALNVFPVADGDTGTNMQLTLKNGIDCATSSKELNTYLKTLSGSMLLGARGNSGVILSQLFRGIYLELSRCEKASPSEMRNAFIRGYKVAYEAVVNPVEGTILTVAREGIEHAAQLTKRSPDMLTLFQLYLSSMEASLETTPQRLQALAEVGVVDSGAKGYILIVQGMLNHLMGKPNTPVKKTEAVAAPAAAPAPAPAVDFSRFNKNSAFEDGYCTEFLLQLMEGKPCAATFRVEQFINELTPLGDSLVVVENDDRVKVHIHTKNPAPVITLAQKYGEFLTFKLENMQLQHNEFQTTASFPAAAPQKQEEPHRLLATVAVVNGAGMEKLFGDLGCTRILDGGPTMNASANDFVNAIQSLRADHIVLLPNNSNTLLAAEQAIKLCNAGNAIILKSRSMAEGYCAIAMDIQDSTDAQARIDSMRQGLNSARTLHISKAIRQFEQDGIRCNVGDYVATNHDGLIASSPDVVEAITQGLMKIEDIDDLETCLFFRGEPGDAQLESTIENAVAEKLPMMECSFLEGGQGIFHWIIGIM